jgi:hypothetical protein
MNSRMPQKGRERSVAKDERNELDDRLVTLRASPDLKGLEREIEDLWLAV